MTTVVKDGKEGQPAPTRDSSCVSVVTFGIGSGKCTRAITVVWKAQLTERRRQWRICSIANAWRLPSLFLKDASSMDYARVAARW